eukprot:CCRYP_005138-RB/>CCRYP_005138-RB protein AED:0.25 eAED:0.25 QI:309/1/0.66/1/0.5/0.33/3/440/100
MNRLLKQVRGRIFTEIRSWMRSRIVVVLPGAELVVMTHVVTKQRTPLLKIRLRLHLQKQTSTEKFTRINLPHFKGNSSKIQPVQSLATLLTTQDHGIVIA